MFHLDLHGVKLQEARRIVRARISECYRYGLRTLRIVYGSAGPIFKSVCQIVPEHEHVMAEELPEWVRYPLEGYKYPIFLVVPMRRNPAPEPLDEATFFQKFRAEDEEDLGQRLLCEMPYQPYRLMYDWKYAARAIAKDCTAEQLAAMCSELGIGGVTAAGVGLSDLMKAARAWVRWVQRKASVAAQVPKPVPEELSVAPEAADMADVALELKEARPPADLMANAEAYLRLADKLIESGEYERALQYLGEAEGLSSSASEQFELAWRRGRILLRMHDASCETWLLRADETCARIYGEDAPQRRKTVRLLINWYACSGEPDRVIEYGRIAGRLFTSELDKMSMLEQYRNQYMTADFLQSAGNYQDALAVLDWAMWTLVLGKTEEQADAITRRPASSLLIPSGMLSDCGLPARDLTRHFMLAAKILRQLRKHAEAWDELRGAEKLATDAADPHLQAEVKLEMGINWRKGEGATHKAQECYASAHELNNRDGTPDIQLRYFINLSSGVAYATSGEPRMAKKAYARASEDADLLFATDHPERAGLLSSQATLCLRRHDFAECTELAQRAAEILQLRAPARHYDIGVALLRSATAQNALQRYDEAAVTLDAARREFDQAELASSVHLRQELQRQESISKNKGRTGGYSSW
jgi:tetratricopeptide (TPR) repeat protein